MAHALHITLRILTGIAGILLLYVAFFLYEDEEEHIQNRLEQLWERIDELQNVSVSKEAAFLKGAAASASRILDYLFGVKLFSLQFVAISAAYSSASFAASFGVLLSLKRHLRAAYWDWVAVMGISLVLGTIPAILHHRETMGLRHRIQRWNAIYIAIMAVVFFSEWIAMDALLTPWGFNKAIAIAAITGYTEGVFFVLTCGILFDLIFVLVFRWVLRRVHGLTQFLPILFCAALLIMMTVIAIAPSALFVWVAMHSIVLHTPLHLPKATFDKYFNPYLLLPSSSNWLDAACALLLILIMLMLLLHRLIWPLIKRPIYAANRKQLIKNTKLLGALGTMLLLYAFPNNPLVKWLTGFLPKIRGG